MGIVSVYLSEEQHEKWRRLCKLGQSGQSKMFQRVIEAAYGLAKLAEVSPKDVRRSNC